MARSTATSPKSLYKVIEKGYGKERLDRDAEAAQAITPAQEDRIHELLRRLNLSEERVKAALRAHGARSFGELGHDVAETVIEKLESRPRFLNRRSQVRVLPGIPLYQGLTITTGVRPWFYRHPGVSMVLLRVGLHSVVSVEIAVHWTIEP